MHLLPPSPCVGLQIKCLSSDLTAYGCSYNEDECNDARMVSDNHTPDSGPGEYRANIADVTADGGYGLDTEAHTTLPPAETAAITIDYWIVHAIDNPKKFGKNESDKTTNSVSNFQSWTIQQQ